jgi:hypothetical protein
MNDLLLFSPDRLFVAILNYAIIHFSYRLAKSYIRRGYDKTERNRTIWNHYAVNHPKKNILDCTVGDCQTI